MSKIGMLAELSLKIDELIEVAIDRELYHSTPLHKAKFRVVCQKLRNLIVEELRDGPCCSIYEKKH